MFPWLPPSSIKRPKTSIGLLLGQNCNILFPGSKIDARHGNIRVRRSLLGDWGYVPNRSDKCMWKFERKKRTHLLQKVNPSSLFSFTPDLPWTQLPRLNLSKTSPLFLCFIEEGYTKIVGQPQVKDKNHYENQDIVPLPTQHLAHSYTASLSVVKVNTIPLIASYKTKILIFLAGKPQKKGKKGTPKATCFLSMDTNSQKSIFLSDTDCRIEDIYKKKGIYAQDFTKY